MEGSLNWVSLLVQVPLVGVFIWFALEMVKRMELQQSRYLDSMEKRDEAYLRTLEEIKESVGCVQDGVNDLKIHHQYDRKDKGAQ